MQQDYESEQNKTQHDPSQQDPSRSFPLPPHESLQDGIPPQDQHEGYDPEPKLSPRNDILYQRFGFYRILTQPSVRLFSEQLPYTSWKRITLRLTTFVVICASLSGSPIQTSLPLVLLSR